MLLRWSVLKCFILPAGGRGFGLGLPQVLRVEKVHGLVLTVLGLFHIQIVCYLFRPAMWSDYRVIERERTYR